MERALDTRRSVLPGRLLRVLVLLLTLALPAGAAEPKPSGTDGDPTLRLHAGNGNIREDLDVEKGKSLLIRTDYRVKRVSVGNPEIADVVVLNPNELNLVAREVGETNVVLWGPTGRAEAALALAVVRPFARIEREMREVLNGEEIWVEGIGDSIALKGRVSSLEVADRAMRVASAFFPEKQEQNHILNLLEVGGDHQVMIEVTIAEMSRTLRREMESDYSALVKAGGKEFAIFNFLGSLVNLDDAVATADRVLLSDRVNFFGRLVDGSDSYNLFLNFLKEKGLMKILAEPTLVARSGQSASFLAGGEVAVPIAQGGAFGSITIEYKQFGVIVEFTPTVMSNNRIHMEISPEISEPDFTLGTTVDGTTVPGFRTRRSSTGVELGDGQAFAIAGLLRDDVSELAAQYPVLGDIPVLGTLFRSKQYQHNETELVLVVRPQLVEPLAPGEVELPTDHYVDPSDYEFYLTNALEGKAREPHRAETPRPQGRSGLIGEAGHRVSIAEAEEEL